MTRHERRLVEILRRELGGSVSAATVERLFELGLIDLGACERRAVRLEVERMARAGTPRCEAMHAAADTFCCSYEKVRTIFYDNHKSRKP